MIAKLAVVIAIFAVVRAGEEPPPPKVHTYNVPVVSKVSYPGPAVSKSVETYSAPSIEKTTTITRTITAPINAPAERQIQYSAPAAPVHAGYGGGQVALGYGGQAAFGGLGGYGGQVALGGYGGQVGGLGGYGGQFAFAPMAHHHLGGYAGHGGQLGYAAPIAHGGYAAPIAHGGYAAAPVLKAYAEPTLALGSPALGFGQGLGGYAAPHGIGLATTYSAPALGYNLGHAHAAGGYGGHAHGKVH